MSRDVWRISEILSKKREVREYMSNFENRYLLREDFDTFVDGFARFLPNDIERPLIHKSLFHLVDQRLDGKRIEEEAWRLLGNISTLRAYRPAPPWTRQTRPEWVPLQILDGRFRKSKKGRPGYVFTFRVLAGSPCPRIITKYWTRKVCYLFGSRLGFGVTGRSDRMQHELELVQFRLLGLIEPELTRRGEPSFSEVQVSPSILKHNKQLIKLRARDGRTDFKCQYSHPCFVCPLGYGIGENTCIVALHPATYETRSCPLCKQRAPFDPYKSRTNLCVNCQVIEEMRR